MQQRCDLLKDFPLWTVSSFPSFEVLKRKLRNQTMNEKSQAEPCLPILATHPSEALLMISSSPHEICPNLPPSSSHCGCKAQPASELPPLAKFDVIFPRKKMWHWLGSCLPAGMADLMVSPGSRLTQKLSSQHVLAVSQGCQLSP